MQEFLESYWAPSNRFTCDEDHLEAHGIYHSHSYMANYNKKLALEQFIEMKANGWEDMRRCKRPDENSLTLPHGWVRDTHRMKVILKLDGTVPGPYAKGRLAR